MAEKPHRAPGTIKRTSGIGGSDASVICGLSQYRTAFELYLEKRGEILPDETDSEIMRFGRRFEAPIADEFAYRTGRKVWRQKKTLRHPEFRFLLANIDRWQERDGIKGVYEGKNHGVRQRSAWVQGGVPVGHYLQLQHYLMVTGCSFGSFGACFGGNEFHSFDVERDDATIAMLLSLEVDFWQRVKSGNPPDYTFGQAGEALVKKMYPQARPGMKAVILEGAEAEGKIKRLLQVKQAIKQREEIEKDLETWIKLQLGEAETGTFLNLATVNWKNGSTNRLDLEKFRKDDPLRAQYYMKETPGRRFSVKPFNIQEIEEEKDSDDSQIIITSGVRQIDLGD